MSETSTTLSSLIGELDVPANDDDFASDSDSDDDDDEIGLG